MAEAPLGADNHFGLFVAGQMYDIRVAVEPELDALQVLLDDLSEDMLTVAHHHQTHDVRAVLGVLSEVVENFRSVGVEPLGCKYVFQAELGLETIESGADALERNAGLADASKYKTLGKSDKWYRSGTSRLPADGGDDRLAINVVTSANGERIRSPRRGRWSR